MSEHISTTSDAGVTYVRLDAPDRVNAISQEMREALIAAIHRCTQDDACSAIVLCGAGGNFSAGGDIKSERPAPQAVARTLRHKMALLQEVVRQVCVCPKPVVAAVQGKAFGAGMSLALACDVVVAADDAQFCAAFGRVGLVPDAGMFHTLPRRVGPARAQHLMLSARLLDAREALAIGVADEVVPVTGLLDAARDQARRLSAIAPLAFASIKSLGTGGAMTLEQAFAEEVRLQPLLALTADYQEARVAFADKRKPAFRGC